METGQFLVERTVPGLHDFLISEVLPGYLRPGAQACDLGAGSGALARRLQDLGANVIACDRTLPEDPPTAFVEVDLDRPGFGRQIGVRDFDLITGIEVIEHLESPMNFLRELAGLLAPTGIALLTTPNMDSLPARLRFALRGKLRMFDGWGDPTHISPIFRHLLLEKYLPRAELEALEILTYPLTGFIAGRSIYKALLRPAAPLLARFAVAGDCMVMILRLVPHGRRPPS